MQWEKQPFYTYQTSDLLNLDVRRGGSNAAVEYPSDEHISLPASSESYIRRPEQFKQAYWQASCNIL
jgi:hypothetical protein